MSRTLDKTKPFGVVCGNHLAAYQQDGVFFDGQGNEVPDQPAQEVVTPESARPAAPGASDEKIASLETDLAETRQILAETRKVVEEQATEIKRISETVTKLSDASFGVKEPAPSEAAGAKGQK